MIIKMTVTDNDFTSRIKNFASRFRSLRFDKVNILLETNNDELRKMIIKNAMIDELFSPFIVASDISDFKEKVCSVVKDCFKRFELDPYLLERFSVEVLDTFTEKWENGEMVYLFTNSDTIIVQ